MLYDALRVLLVDEGPLTNLYAYQLPPEQTAEVDAAFIPQGGGNPKRYLGSTPVTGGPAGVTHDGGVLWLETSVQFQLRGTDPEDPGPVMQAADWIRNLLVQYAGTSVFRADEEVIRCDITTAPHHFGQDEQERIVMAVGFMVWHKPV